MTASDSFRARIQRSEEHRAVLMAGVYAAMALLAVLRRLAGGAVMAENCTFVPTIAVLAGAAMYEVWACSRLRAATLESRLLARWRLNVTAVVELAAASGVMVVQHWWSPRDAVEALSAPAVLLFPLTVLVSVLRLRARATLMLGLGAAAVHLLLTLDTLRVRDVEPSRYPVLLSYSVLLVMTGIGGMVVTRAARRYVAESVEEAYALERASARLAGMERDIEVAHEIQAGLLPAGPPEFPGFDIVGMNIAAERTGGDYYDWQLLPDRRLLVVMADVTGHGIGPALVMAVCRAYARASAPLDADLSTLLVRLNGLLHADLRGARFITLAFAVLDRGGGVELLSAGHGPSFLYSARTGAVEQFGGDGLPLAVMADEKYGPTRFLTFERGDVLVMLTDGVFEWANPEGQQFGTTRVAETIAGCAGEGAESIMKRLHGAVLEFVGSSKQQDDLTIVVIKRGDGPGGEG